jgi:hypothetical protein
MCVNELMTVNDGEDVLQKPCPSLVFTTRSKRESLNARSVLYCHLFIYMHIYRVKKSITSIPLVRVECRPRSYIPVMRLRGFFLLVTRFASTVTGVIALLVIGSTVVVAWEVDIEECDRDLRLVLDEHVPGQLSKSILYALVLER